MIVIMSRMVQVERLERCLLYPSLARRYTRHARIQTRRLFERAPERLEAGLEHVVRVLAVRHLQVDRQARVHRDRLEEVLDQVGVERLDLARGQRNAVDEVRAEERRVGKE